VIIISLATYTYGFTDKVLVESEYHIIRSHVKYCQLILDSGEKDIHNLFNKQMKMADKLYSSIKCIAIDGRIEGLYDAFHAKFHEDFSFANNRQTGLNMIHELLILYPELKKDPQVTLNISALQMTLREMFNTVVLYNNNVQFYKTWEKKWNNSDYIVEKEGALDEHKYTQFSHLMILKF